MVTAEPLVPSLLAAFYVAAALLSCISAVRYWRRTHDRRAETALVISAILAAFAVSAVIALGGLNGVIQDQETITFWQAAVRACAAVLALELAFRWWRAAS